MPYRIPGKNPVTRGIAIVAFAIGIAIAVLIIWIIVSYLADPSSFNMDPGGL
ncbi:hypothetical protein NGB36_26265 [Streptomyces sp. RB6PN25]|uniref:Uncharacterized protein n=1 Tax=Streptomyces humicola TaxID=2953240 RepID=A0ABT1Q242_9ACTN|nr:hypothetical protein [Streptomyces humicola]MCQ4083996.1 hypothetical protein [Streptomyces humicola]